MISYVLHADDLGLSHSINKAIFRAIDNGCVRSVSFIANGHATKEAAEFLSARPDIKVSVHLNLQEGRSAPNPGGDSLFSGPEGQLRTSFSSLLRQWLHSNAEAREKMRLEIQREFRSQILAALELLGQNARSLRIDSHTHIHALPFIFDSILSMHDEFEFQYVRVPQEPFYIASGEKDWHRPLGVNLIKHSLLNALSSRMTSRLSSKRIGFNAYLLGVLYSGRVTPNAIEKGVSACQKKLASQNIQNGLVEMLVHPGQATPDEKNLWEGRPELWSYYSSENRALELGTSMSATVKNIVANR